MTRTVKSVRSPEDDLTVEMVLILEAEPSATLDIMRDGIQARILTLREALAVARAIREMSEQLAEAAK